MFGRRVTQPWSLRAYRPASFCVYALLVDGLRVPPFDRHPDGDGRLRAAGMDAPGWRDWLRAISEQAYAPVRQRHDQDPDALWAGDPQVREQLRALRTAYSQRPSAQVTFDPRSFRPNGRLELREMWRLARSSQLANVFVQAYWVPYPAPVCYRALDTTVVIGSPAQPTYIEALRCVTHPGEQGVTSLTSSEG